MAVFQIDSEITVSCTVYVDAPTQAQAETEARVSLEDGCWVSLGELVGVELRDVSEIDPDDAPRGTFKAPTED